MWSYGNSRGNEVDRVKRAEKNGEGYVISSLVLRDLLRKHSPGSWNHTIGESVVEADSHRVAASLYE